MDDTGYKVAIAGFLHDIGKFAERASGKKEEVGEIKPAFYLDEEFLNSNMDLYQPHFKGKYTHKHAVYTAAFIDHIEKLLPRKFNKGEWGLGDSFMNLAAGHHKPETPLQWIVAIADRVSSGFDRDGFENTYNLQSDISEYKRIRLSSVLEQLSIDKNEKTEYLYKYPLKEISPQHIFPRDGNEIVPETNDKAEKEYEDLLFGFVDNLEKISKTGHGENIQLWFEHFDSLFMIYASHIPAATVGQVVPDVSLYDHSKTTSAIASALYLYHKETETLDTAKIKDYSANKFLIINSDFYGIQDFIFSEGGSTRKASSKLLRGRSFYVSLLSELAADMLCRKIGLPISSIILNAAGKFTVLAPNTDRTKEKVNDIEAEINEWLINNFYGQTSMGIASVEASCDDFVSKNFSTLWENLSREIEKRKYSKVDLNIYGGSVSEYLNSFNNDLDRPLCPFCGKRPSSEGVENDGYIQDADESSACKICRDHIFIGANLVREQAGEKERKEKRIAITTVDAELHGNILKEPIYGRYQMSFDVGGKLLELLQSESLLKYWDIRLSEDGNIAKDITAKFISGYVPKYREEDVAEEMINRILHGEKSDKKKNELFDMIKRGDPKTFNHIAKMALNKIDNSDKFKGIEALGILKADVDNLGLLFACGLPKEKQTLSRLATLSRQLNYFFTVFLPYKLKTSDEFKDIYTVFAGGDDLFLIGPWNRIIDFADFLYGTFSNYVCNNPDITISAGISINKPGEPVTTIAERAEEALEQSKFSGRNRITLFEETVTWDDFKDLSNIKKQLHEWLDTGKINKAMLFRFNELLEMAKQEKEIRDSKFNIQMKDMECLKWRARFTYTVVRNIGRHLKSNDKNEAIEDVMKSAVWLDSYHGALKIPLWQIIYNQR